MNTEPLTASEPMFSRLLRSLLTVTLLLSVPFCRAAREGGGGEPEAGLESRSSAQATAPAPRQGMLPVPQGMFLFGAAEEEVEYFISRSQFNFPGMVEKIRSRFITPQRAESLEEFYIHQFEVTNQQFKAFLDATGYSPDNKKDFLKLWEKGTYPDWAETFPVVWVSLRDAQAYCSWIGGWVPTELEWEKAARGIDGRDFPWGNKAPARETANIRSEQAEPVGNRPFDVSPYQIYDLGGNVAEWTQTVVEFEGSRRVVLRGGSFRESGRETMTCHRDLAATPDTRRENLGFRCAAR